MIPFSVQPQGAGSALIYEAAGALTAVPPAYTNSENANLGGVPEHMRFTTTFSPANGTTVADLVMWGGPQCKAQWQIVLYTVTGGALS